MEQEVNPDVKAVFQTLSEDGKKLLISMTHASHKSGMVMDAIEVISQLEGDKLGQALAALRANNLIQTGKLENQEFVLAENGNRYRLTKGVKKSVLSGILGFDNEKVEALLQY